MTGVVVGVLAVLVLAVYGYAVWQVGVGEREALQHRTLLDLVESRASRWPNRLDVAFRTTTPGRWLARRLDRAGVRWRVLDVGAGLVALGLLSFLTADRFISWWIALLVAGGAVRLSLTWFDRLEVARREAFVGQLPEVARVMSNATSAGLSLRSAMRMAGDDVADPAGGELRRLTEELDLGTPLSDALNKMHDRLPSRELSLLTRTLIIQARAGGAVVTALREMSESLEARKDLRREIRTMLSGAVFTSWVVLILGVGSLVMLNLIAPGTLNRVTSSVIGQVVLLVAGSMYALGFFLIRRTTRIEV
jgi:tight adherence protein B